MKELYILILLFYIYSFLGWIIEIISSLYRYKRFINRGFLIGPIVPLYGFAGVLILIVLSRYDKDPLVFFLLSIILCSSLEYFTSYIMEKIFKNRWWDYSYKKYNINGRICLECSALFGIISIIVYYGITPPILSFLTNFDYNILKYISLVLLIITIIDVILSFNIIINLKNISNNIRFDSTEIITKKVKEILLSKNVLHRRLVKSFPNMKISNELVYLKEKIKLDKEKLIKEKERIKQVAKKRK